MKQNKKTHNLGQTLLILNVQNQYKDIAHMIIFSFTPQILLVNKKDKAK